MIEVTKVRFFLKSESGREFKLLSVNKQCLLLADEAGLPIRSLVFGGKPCELMF